ncbi:uncharacterized protein I303_106077 [Kwoniella dejecticola CBS 10117]|uniref:Uncharacterized protein n=1 Tax=Kwoniella dejecticola CBS 10117 TaxID=1296121 RepID=A0A1A6A176_9TREE|nr:uncharacterized protein I303_06097 [Kwoniella dejecticola CBS 10117]OBR83814.1 hypothetical protein I303_06097 [Kwoniella dejecticola CBS 10117]
MSVEEHIQAAAQRNDELLSVLAETDHAIPDLNQQRSYITDLEGQLSAINNKLSTLDKRREKDLKDHLKYRDSVFKRFAYKASGQKEKFQDKAAKEEKDYFDGLRETQLNEDQKKSLNDLLSQAKTTEGDLVGVAEKHKNAQGELDRLYDSIFQGQTPNFPDEDRLEEYSNQTLQEYHNTRQTVDAENQVAGLIREASQAMRMALNHLSSAESYSTWDMWGGGTMSDMMERNELSSADRAWSRVQMLNLQAKHLSPYVRDLPEVRVAGGSIMSDVFFDNIITDMAFHEKIKQSQYEMNQAADMVERNLQENKIRLDQLNSDMAEKSRRLEQSRKDLQAKRSDIFRRISRGA